MTQRYPSLAHPTFLCLIFLFSYFYCTCFESFGTRCKLIFSSICQVANNPFWLCWIEYTSNTTPNEASLTSNTVISKPPSSSVCSNNRKHLSEIKLWTSLIYLETRIERLLQESLHVKRLNHFVKRYKISFWDSKLKRCILI